jgi:4'-phosphopantetheinyl transferase
MRDAWQLWLATPDAASAFEPAAQSFEDRRRWQRLEALGERPDWRVSRALLAHVRPHGSAHSLSHSGAHALLALGPPEAALGVDIERIDARRDCARLARFAFAADEAAQLEALEPGAQVERFYTLWTLKEACIKALRLTLLDGLRRCVFTVRAGAWHGEVPVARHWAASVYRPRPTHYAAVFALADAAPDWVQHEWPRSPSARWQHALSLRGGLS